MRRDFSLYLDLVRIVSCAVVVLSHLGHGHLIGGILWPFTFMGNEAVMVFFVMSGFVIAHVSAQVETKLEQYVAARLARLYSVILPAMLLTLVLDGLGARLDPADYARAWGSPEHGLAMAYVLSAAMLNQSWAWSQHFGSNGAYWSIPYEFWYYFIFGTATYLRGKQRIVWLLIGLIFAGPKILLLMPVWLLGVGVYWAAQRRPLQRHGALLAATSLGVVLWMLYVDFSSAGRNGFMGMKPDSLIWQYTVGLCLALHLYGMSQAARHLALPLGFATRPIRYVAGGTLAIYLFHLPILEFLHAVTVSFGRFWFTPVLMLLVPFVFSLTVGRWCEARKRTIRDFLLRQFGRRQMFDRVAEPVGEK
jgi:peptidoglycan/LPS O-acetylase OafA/YrhL